MIIFYTKYFLYTTYLKGCAFPHRPSKDMSMETDHTIAWEEWCTNTKNVGEMVYEQMNTRNIRNKWPPTPSKRSLQIKGKHIFGYLINNYNI